MSESVAELRARGCICSVPPVRTDDAAIMHRDCPLHAVPGRADEPHTTRN
jgi:hypothetical protein